MEEDKMQVFENLRKTIEEYEHGIATETDLYEMLVQVSNNWEIITGIYR